MKIAWETLVAALLIAASIAFVGRYQISAMGAKDQISALQSVYRLDRWTGKVVDLCYQKKEPNGSSWHCPDSDNSAPDALDSTAQ